MAVPDVLLLEIIDSLLPGIIDGGLYIQLPSHTRASPKERVVKKTTLKNGNDERKI